MASARRKFSRTHPGAHADLADRDVTIENPPALYAGIRIAAAGEARHHDFADQMAGEARQGWGRRVAGLQVQSVENKSEHAHNEKMRNAGKNKNIRCVGVRYSTPIFTLKILILRYFLTFI